MGWLEGLLTGYVDRHHAIEKEKMDEAVRSQEQEAKIYQALLSSPNQELREMAGAGMLDMANPLRKTKGFKGFLGEVQRSPMLPLIRKYMQTEQPYEHEISPAIPGRTETEQRTIPKVDIEQVRPQLPGHQDVPPPPPSSASLPATSPTEPGTPAMTPPPPPPTAPAAPPGALALPGPQPQQIDEEALAANPPLYDTKQGIEGGLAFKGASPPVAPPSPPWAPESFTTTREIPGTPAVTETRSRLPQGFPTTEDIQASTYRGRGRGEYEQAVDMFRRARDPNPEKRAAEFIMAKEARAGGFAFASVPGETTLPDGTRATVFRPFNKALGQYVDENGDPDPNFVPRTIVGTGQWFEQAAIASGYTRGSMVPAADFERVSQLAQQLEQRAAKGRVVAGQQGQLASPVLPEESQKTGAVVGAPRSDQTGQVVPRIPTDVQRKDVAYYNRAQFAAQAVSTPNPNLGGTTLEQRIADQNLARQFQGSQGVPNVLQTADQQAYRQAQRTFTEARLRLESGAAVPVQELINDARTFFAVPGDDPATIAQKAAARAQVIDGLAYAAGPAYQEYYGAPYEPRGVPAGPQTQTTPRGVSTGPPAPPGTSRSVKQPDGSWKIVVQ